MTPDKQISKVILTFASIITVGIAGLMTIEGWSFLDALYMTVITVSTVGYKEVHDLSVAGQVFIIVFIILGVGSFLYVITNLAEYVVAGQLKGAIGKKKMKKKIGALKDHYILCGFGRVGQHVALELQREGIEFVIIDNNPAALARCDSLGYLHVEGSASEDDVLKEAGIHRAKGLVAAIDSDAENVYVTLSAKALKDRLYVVARASSKEAEHKLLKANADRVISPYSIGGKRLAGLLLRPNVVEFLDLVMHNEEANLFMEEVEVIEGSKLEGLTIGEARRRCTSGANLLAIKKGTGEAIVPAPGGDVVLSRGDLLIALGTREQLKEIETMS